MFTVGYSYMILTQYTKQGDIQNKKAGWSRIQKRLNSQKYELKKKKKKKR